MIRKQNKVLNMINRSSTNYEASLNAKLHPDDECYTSLDEVNKELQHWAPKFEGKDIICPCDWDIFDTDDVYSITVEFDDERKLDISSASWYKNKVKRVRWTTKDGIEEKLDGEEAHQLLKDRVKCNFVRSLVNLGTQHAFNSVTASGYNPDTNKGIKYQDVDYSKYDVCITNPPFSLLKDFAPRMVKERDTRPDDSEKPFNFIFISQLEYRSTPCVGLPLMLKKCYLGYNRCVQMNFSNDNSANKKKSINVDWITSYSDAQDEFEESTQLETGVNFSEYGDDFFEMENITMKDGTHPIRIADKRIIPDDYTGWMFGSCSVLDRIKYSEFEWYLTSAKKYFNKDYPELNPMSHSATNDMLNHNGKNFRHGILFRRLPNKIEE